MTIKNGLTFGKTVSITVSYTHLNTRIFRISVNTGFEGNLYCFPIVSKHHWDFYLTDHPTGNREMCIRDSHHPVWPQLSRGSLDQLAESGQPPGGIGQTAGLFCLIFVRTRFFDRLEPLCRRFSGVGAADGFPAGIGGSGSITAPELLCRAGTVSYTHL